MNKESSWLFDKAAKEDGAQVSVGGLIGDIEAMGKGLAGCTVTNNPEPFTLSGIKIYSWPGYPWNGGFYDRVPGYDFYKPLSGPPKDDNLNWVKIALDKASELAIKEKEAKAEQQLNYVDPEVDKLERKLKDIQSKIETKRKQKQKASKIKELSDLIASAEAELASL